jgi:hypothetical protein
MKISVNKYLLDIENAVLTPIFKLYVETYELGQQEPMNIETETMGTQRVQMKGVLPWLVHWALAVAAQYKIASWAGSRAGSHVS